jgi:hypothetical protein
MTSEESYINERLDHLGIVAGVCQEIGLACAGYIGYPFQNEEKKAVRSIFLPPYW